VKNYPGRKILSFTIPERGLITVFLIRGLIVVLKQVLGPKE
jgi:hypothetical protein